MTMCREFLLSNLWDLLERRRLSGGVALHHLKNGH